MDLFQTLILAGVQGITESRSISSPAHPIRVPARTGWEDQGLAFDVAGRDVTLRLILVWKAIGRRASPA